MFFEKASSHAQVLRRFWWETLFIPCHQILVRASTARWRILRTIETFAQIEPQNIQPQKSPVQTLFFCHFLFRNIPDLVSEPLQDVTVLASCLERCDGAAAAVEDFQERRMADVEALIRIVRVAAPFQ